MIIHDVFGAMTDRPQWKQSLLSRPNISRLSSTSAHFKAWVMFCGFFARFGSARAVTGCHILRWCLKASLVADVNVSVAGLVSVYCCGGLGGDRTGYRAETGWESLGVVGSLRRWLWEYGGVLALCGGLGGAGLYGCMWRLMWFWQAVSLVSCAVFILPGLDGHRAGCGPERVGLFPCAVL